MDMGSLTYVHIWVRAVHTKAAQELTRRDRKKMKTDYIPHPAPFSDLKSDAL